VAVYFNKQLDILNNEEVMCLNFKSQQSYIRFKTPEELEEFLEEAGSADFDFRAIPISGEPETFHFSTYEDTITREPDGDSFDNLDDFICYAFQCDADGYARTEYVDLELLD
jgi:hypothetical protein